MYPARPVSNTCSSSEPGSGAACAGQSSGPAARADTRQAPAAACDPGATPDRRTDDQRNRQLPGAEPPQRGRANRPRPRRRPGQRNPDADSESVARVTLTPQGQKQLDALAEPHLQELNAPCIRNVPPIAPSVPARTTARAYQIPAGSGLVRPCVTWLVSPSVHVVRPDGARCRRPVRALARACAWRERGGRSPGDEPRRGRLAWRRRPE